MSNDKKMRLLTELLRATQSEATGVTRRRFLAAHPRDVDDVDSLIEAGEIRVSDGMHLRLPLLGLATLAEAVPEAEPVHYLCAHLFDVLRAAFLRDPDAKLSESKIVTLAEMPQGQVARALTYLLLDAPIFESWGGNVEGQRHDIVVSDRILRYQTLAEVISAMRAQVRATPGEVPRYTDDAARAVFAAIASLTSAGKRAYVRTVPLEAENILVQRSGGRIARDEASGQIQAAIAGLSQEGRIDAFVESQQDWLIKTPLEAVPATAEPNRGARAVTTSPGTAKHAYVDPARLDELKSIGSTEKCDLTRLVRMCEELNLAFDQDAFITCSMLVRSIVDHVPPIFGCKSFSDVANNYAGGKSFRDSMQHLDKSLRNHANGNLHTQIRRKESLPTRTQIAFWADLDKLLEEAIRVLRDEKS